MLKAVLQYSLELLPLPGLTSPGMPDVVCSRVSRAGISAQRRRAEFALRLLCLDDGLRVLDTRVACACRTGGRKRWLYLLRSHVLPGKARPAARRPRPGVCGCRYRFGNSVG
jgi:hypothetical protein